jgi:putative monooxygenase
VKDREAPKHWFYSRGGWLMPKSALMTHASRTWTQTSQGIRMKMLLTKSAGSESMLNGLAELEPGIRSDMHFHNCDETILILAGTLTLEIDGVVWEAAELDAFWIPARTVHAIANRSSIGARTFWTFSSTEATLTLTNGATRYIDGRDQPGK